MLRADALLEPEKRLESFRQKIPCILEHCELAVKIKAKGGVLEMRRHLGSYVKASMAPKNYGCDCSQQRSWMR